MLAFDIWFLCDCFLQLRDLALANVGSIERRNDLEKRLKILTPEELKDLVCEKVCPLFLSV